MNKILDTMKVSGGDYSKVPTRLKEFRQDNPRASVTSKHEMLEDGGVIFTTTIIKDKKDEYSADSTGTAYYNVSEMKKPKAFEKLETVSVGRALSLIGYLNNGEVASTEEMEDFYSYKQDKIDEAVASLEATNDLEELKTVFKGLGTVIAEKAVVSAKDTMKAKFTEKIDESN